MTMPVEPTNKSPSKPPDKLDEFHPEMPQIPGVRNARPSAATTASNANKRRLVQIGGLAAAVLLIGVTILWWVESARHRAPESSPTETPATESSVPAPSPTESSPSTLTTEGSTIAATAEDLVKPWSAKKFTFRKSFTRENVNAMVIRLPGGGLWAFALQEPYGRCELEFVTDLDQMAKQYGYRASHPMVANPCNSTVYDPLKVGPLGGEVWARGEIVQGAGLRPPISINVQVSGNSIIADRIE
jgi:hypothetical protein